VPQMSVLRKQYASEHAEGLRDKERQQKAKRDLRKRAGLRGESFASVPCTVPAHSVLPALLLLEAVPPCI